MLMREENRRHLQLTDLFSLNLKNENLTSYTTHVCILNNEKMNQTEQIEYKIVVRHKNSLLCIILQLAFLSLLSLKHHMKADFTFSKMTAMI